jgi:cytochrome c oxidase subunit IV
MSASDTEAHTTSASDEPHTHHPTPRQYVRIALILGALTALEVSTYFFEFGVLAIPLLIVLMAIKFVMVASWFMHLKFDSKIFGRMMYSGLVLALTLYLLTVAIVVFDPFGGAA